MVQHLAQGLLWKPLLLLMVNLSTRSHKKELLDEDNIPFAEIKKNMQELNIINSRLGGHRITQNAVKYFAKLSSCPLLVCEIGCGGGDNLAAIDRIKKIDCTFIGVDNKQACIEFAKSQYKQLEATWQVCDYENASFINKPDVIFSSLFCHHFTDSQIVDMLTWMKNNSAQGFFINDLQRHPMAYYLIKWITKIFSKSYLVKHDAPLSVARSFTRSEWVAYFAKADIVNYSIRWQWAFRYLIISKNNNK